MAKVCDPEEIQFPRLYTEHDIRLRPRELIEAQSKLIASLDKDMTGCVKLIAKQDGEIERLQALVSGPLYSQDYVDVIEHQLDAALEALDKLSGCGAFDIPRGFVKPQDDELLMRMGFARTEIQRIKEMK